MIITEIASFKTEVRVSTLNLTKEEIKALLDKKCVQCGTFPGCVGKHPGFNLDSNMDRILNCPKCNNLIW
jgi:hypothetical protein